MKIRAMTGEEFWPIYKQLEPKLFKTMTFSAHQYMTPNERRGFEKRKSFIKHRIEVFFGLFNERGKMVGWSASFQTQPNELYMMSSAVMPKYRRKGWYSKLLLATMKEAKKLGFQVIASNHQATNSPVIIAKLKLGFVISGFELSDQMGVLVKMTYSFSSIRNEVMKFRSGEHRPTKRVKKALKLK